MRAWAAGLERQRRSHCQVLRHNKDVRRTSSDRFERDAASKISSEQQFLRHTRKNINGVQEFSAVVVLVTSWQVAGHVHT